MDDSVNLTVAWPLVARLVMHIVPWWSAHFLPDIMSSIVVATLPHT